MTAQGKLRNKVSGLIATNNGKRKQDSRNARLTQRKELINISGKGVTFSFGTL